MKVFLTSGTGYMGAAIAEQLLARGDQVVALARTEQRAQQLRAKGIEPVLGDLTSLDVLRQAATSADAVVHVAFVHDGSLSWADTLALDRAATGALIDALSGTNKALVTSSGGAVLGDTGALPVAEDCPVDVAFQPVAQRSLGERDTVLAAGRGVRSCVIRLPPYVYGHGGSVFLPLQLAAYRAAGTAYYFGAPDHLVSAVHVDDAAAAYVLAIDKAPAGSVFHVANEHGLRADAIAQAMAANIGGGTPVQGLTLEQAAATGVVPMWIVAVIAINVQTDSAKAERLLGWKPADRPGMLEDIRSGSYKAK